MAYHGFYSSVCLVLDYQLYITDIGKPPKFGFGKPTISCKTPRQMRLCFSKLECYRLLFPANMGMAPD
jgi:hypothetical protein